MTETEVGKAWGYCRPIYRLLCPSMHHMIAQELVVSYFSRLAHEVNSEGDLYRICTSAWFITFLMKCQKRTVQSTVFSISRLNSNLNRPVRATYNLRCNKIHVQTMFMLYDLLRRFCPS